MPAANTGKRATPPSDEKIASELLRKDQGEASALLQQDETKAEELMGQQQEEAKELLSQNKPDQTAAAELLVQHQEQASDVLRQGQVEAAELLGQKQRKAAELLRQIQVIVESSTDAIIGTTLDGEITSWNGGAVKMFGYLPDEVIGKSGSSLFPPEMWNQVPALLERIKAKQAVLDYDIGGLRKDGSRFDMAISISPIFSGDGTVIGASVVERDISQRKTAERHVKELNETRDRFITIISHQLRTPLTAVNWNLESLLNGDFGKLEETQRKFLQVTHHASVEITNRIHNLLTAMDVEEGRVRYETAEVALDSLCAAVVAEMQNRCALKSLSCGFTPPAAGIPNITGDADKIRRVVAILVENAIGYTNEKGTVTAKLERNGDVARFEVTDTGVGIPKTEQEHVFTRFFRASNASVMQPDAFGLGLFLAKSFIEQHGGKIGFTSEEGKGSTFWFELPIRS